MAKKQQQKPTAISKRSASRQITPQKAPPRPPAPRRQALSQAIEPPGRGFAVVGIGASAGGLDAFKRFFAKMPADSGIAFVLVQHLAPTHESFTDELLGKQTGMPVVAVADGMPVEPNRVHVIPPNAYLTISGERLHLTEPVKQRGVRVPIDFFFRSLANEQQQRAICIILSGTGSDGTLGLREVKAAGGMVMVQDPATAQFDGMPRSAISTGAVDYVLPIEQMPDVLIRYVQHAYVHGARIPPSPADQAKDPLQTIIALLRARVKYDFSCYKKGTLTRRVQRRMGLHQIQRMPDYVRYLRENSEEAVALYKDLLIGVTNFFREPDAWQVLADQVITPLVQAHDPDTPLRVWVPGCAAGEEAYSLAMLVTSINEELQSTNEELETSKEELQSLNEELTTVNSQLEQKVGELEATTDDLTNLLSSTDIATVFLDRQLGIKRFTPATARLLRLIPTDIGRPLGDIARNFADEDLSPDIEQVLERLVPIAKEVRAQEGAWYVRRVLPYRTEDNRIDGLVLTFTDITARKAFEAKIQAARSYAEGIVNTVRDPLVVLSSDLRVHSCNPAFYQMFQVSPEVTVGRLIYELSDRQWDIPALRTLLEEILPQGQRNQESNSSTNPTRAVVDYEVDYSFQDLGPRSLLLNACVIESDQEPAELILLAIEDITERKRAAEELRQLNETLEQRVAERARSHARLASLVASTADAVIALDLDGTITDWNAGAARLFGYSEHEAIGQDISILVPPNRPSQYRQIVAQLRRGDTKPSFEIVWQTKDGQPKDVSLTLSLIKQPAGDVVGVSGIVRDITDRKRLEEQLVELAEQERRRIGQELHDSLGQQISALGVLATSLQTIFEEQSSPNLERMEQIVRGIEDAKAQVRLLSRGLLPVEVDAEGLMHALRELTARREEMFGVACIFDCPRPVHVEDNATATHLYRIAQESINNAVQHARAEQIIVSLCEKRGITLQIRDNGGGLPADTSAAAGSGLRIMRYRAGLIGGTLSIAAGEDGGTVVTCFIPGRECHVEG